MSLGELHRESTALEDGSADRGGLPAVVGVDGVSCEVHLDGGDLSGHSTGWCS